MGQPEPRERVDVDDQGSALVVENLSITARIGDQTRTIVRDVDLDVARGETIAIVGESGSGKSLTARALLGLLPAGVHAEGAVRIGTANVLELSERELRRLRGSRIGLVLQDPFSSLNPLRHCGTQITELVAAADGSRLSRRARREEAWRRLAEVGIHDEAVADRYPFQLSGGMRQRVAIAAALAGDPDILIADEPSTALDVTTQREVLALLRSLQDSRQMTLVLITHDLRVAFAAATRIYVLYAGSVLEVGPAAALEAKPLHPYTLGLLLADPPLDRRVAELSTMAGSVPRAEDVADRCPFAARCAWAAPECTVQRTPLVAVADMRSSACVRLPEIRDLLHEHRSEQPAAVPEVHPDPESTPVVLVEQVVKEFHRGGRRSGAPFRAVNEVSIAIAPGESVGLVGESGSGKTTLARCLVNLETVTSGRIVVGDIELSSRPLARADQLRLAHFAQIVFQDPNSSLNPVRTVGATLAEAISVIRPRARRAAVDELLARVGLPSDYADRKPAALSGGERQRVAIARALAVEPKLLVCDEPVSALDVSVQAQILNLLTSLRRSHQMTYLLISHDLAVVRQVVDRAYVMHRGVVVEEGPIADILDRPKHPYTAKLVESVPRSDDEWLGGS